MAFPPLHTCLQASTPAQWWPQSWGAPTRASLSLAMLSTQLPVWSPPASPTGCRSVCWAVTSSWATRRLPVVSSSRTAQQHSSWPCQQFSSICQAHAMMGHPPVTHAAIAVISAISSTVVAALWHNASHMQQLCWCLLAHMHGAATPGRPFRPVLHVICRSLVRLQS